MSSPRARKRREGQARRRADQKNKSQKDPHIGYFGRQGRDVLRHEDEAVVIVGSRLAMQQMLERRGRTTMTICDVTFCEIMMGLVEGAAFCFDDQAYARLLQPAREAGLALKDPSGGKPNFSGEPAVRLQLDWSSPAGHD